MSSEGIYVDSSVWNLFFDEHVPELRAQTKAFFDRAEALSTELFVSDVVLQEISMAPGERLKEISALLSRVDPGRIDLGEESALLAEAYIAQSVVSGGHLADARHVAIATVAGLDAIVSWNYRHLVNRRRRNAFNGVNAIRGYRPIEIISPPEVFNE